MVRCLLGHMTGPKRCRAIHKAQRFSRMRSGHPAVKSLVISCTMSAVSGHLLYYVCSLWSSPVLCLQSLVISCTMSAVSGHLLYCPRSLWSSPVLCPQSLVLLLFCACSLW
ncbi:unnamed protein product, partial [Staurois parvus]